MKKRIITLFIIAVLWGPELVDLSVRNFLPNRITPPEKPTNRPLGLIYIGKVYELSQDSVIKSTRVKFLPPYEYIEVNREYNSEHLENNSILKIAPKGTQFTIREVEITYDGGRNEKTPILWAEFPSDVAEKFVDVSYMFMFDETHYSYLGNKKKERDVLISECVKPDPKLMREIAHL